MVMPFFVDPSESSETAFPSFQLFYQERKVLDETLLKADQADRTQRESLPPVSPPSSPSPGFCGGHMWVTLSSLTSPVDFFLLSLESNYYSVARVGRLHQEQEVRKASRAAVFLPGPDPPVSSHGLQSMYSSV